MNVSIRHHILATLAFVVPTIILGFSWKFALFKEQYTALGLYRADIAAPLAMGSLFIQAIFFAWLCQKLLLNLPFGQRTLKMFIYTFPLGWSYGVCMVGAKHLMTSVWTFTLYETAFILLMHLVACPLIALSYPAPVNQ